MPRQDGQLHLSVEAGWRFLGSDMLLLVLLLRRCGNIVLQVAA